MLRAVTFIANTFSLNTHAVTAALIWACLFINRPQSVEGAVVVGRGTVYASSQLVYATFFKDGRICASWKPLVHDLAHEEKYMRREPLS